MKKSDLLDYLDGMANPYGALANHHRPSADAARLAASELRALRSAAKALYLAGYWILPGKSNLDEQAAMWEDLRDALGLAPGTSTALGLGPK